MALYEDLSEDAACGFGTIECVVPRIVDEVSELGENYRCNEIFADVSFDKTY
jgi:hypothetical protein